MRLSDAVVYPKAGYLGKLDDEQLLYEFGYEVGQQARTLGVHIALGPVADVNSNPKNPVIGLRSLGDNPNVVARKAQLIADGLCDVGVLACAKHFPGHGDTSVDSHWELPVVHKNKAELDAVELVPFAHLVSHAIPLVMTAHLALPKVTGSEHVPATLSSHVIHDCLRNELGFEGLVITDGLGMKALADHYTVEEVAVMAIQAGNDILLCPVDVPRTCKALCNAVRSGVIAQEVIDASVRRVLAAKYDLMMRCPESFTPCYRHDIFHGARAYALQQKLQGP